MPSVESAERQNYHGCEVGIVLQPFSVETSPLCRWVDRNLYHGGHWDHRGSSTGEGALVQQMGLAFGAQDLTQVSINFYGVLRSLVDHLDPAAQVFGRD